MVYFSSKHVLQFPRETAIAKLRGNMCEHWRKNARLCATVTNKDCFDTDGRTFHLGYAEISAAAASVAPFAVTVNAAKRAHVAWESERALSDYAPLSLPERNININTDPLSNITDCVYN
jgi:hypothetical protein